MMVRAQGAYIMRIGILGSGVVGQVIGTGFAHLGHLVKMGSRDPCQKKILDWISRTGPNASVGLFSEAARFAELAVLCTDWLGTGNAVDLAGHENLAGKIIIDTTNPLQFVPDTPPSLTIGHSISAGEEIQHWLPRSRVVKAFNIVGYQHMVNPSFTGGPPDMIICGNDPLAKLTVTEILNSFGWVVIDIGGIDGSRYLESLAAIWFRLFFTTKSQDHAFKILTN